MQPQGFPDQSRAIRPERPAVNTIKLGQITDHKGANPQPVLAQTHATSSRPPCPRSPGPLLQNSAFEAVGRATEGGFEAQRAVEILRLACRVEPDAPRT